MRPKNKKENAFYSILIQILILLGGVQLIYTFCYLTFTTAGNICTGAYSYKISTKGYYHVEEGKFIFWVTIVQISVFMTLACAMSIYKHMQSRIAILMKENGAV